MNTLGEKLRRQRLAKGVSLADIANETRIGSRYLEALETGDTKVLPGTLFAKSFARQYARFVGLDAAEIEVDLAAAFPPEDNMPALASVSTGSSIHVAPLPDVVGANPTFAPQLYRSAIVLLLVVAACSGVFMGWQRWSTPAVAAGAASHQPPPMIPAAEPVSSAITEPAAEPPKRASIEVNVPQEAPGMAVQVVASEKTWVSITVNGRSVFSGILQENEERILPGVERAKMVIGNAGGVDVITDGKSIGPIGPRGQVRFVLLSPDGPRILTKKEVDEQRMVLDGRS